MLKNKNIICISSIDWDFVWQGHQELMSLFAKADNCVFFIDNTGARMPRLKDIPRIKKRIFNWIKGVKGIRKEMDNLYIFSPILFPFPYSTVFKKINAAVLMSIIRAWMKVFNFNSPIIIVFLPTPLSLYMVNRIEYRDLLIYYCVDRFSSAPGVSKKIKKSEQRFFEQSDLVFAVTDTLRQDCLRFRDDVQTLYFGVDIDKFIKVRNEGRIPDEVSGLGKPIIGYIGGVHHWIDFELIDRIASLHPEYSIVMVGPIQTSNPFSKRKNIYLLGQKGHEEIPYYINAFSVCIIPYRLTPYTLVGRPTKLNEYLIMGKPVVSTNLPEVESFSHANGDIIEVADTHEGFIKAIERSLTQDSPAKARQRIEVAKRYSWTSIAERMSNIIENKIFSRRQEKKMRWKDILADFYAHAQKKLSKVILLAAGFYMLIFYTGFVWILAEPLKVRADLVKADAVVVFAGGVGESGKAGQGYEERVQYAVELYKQGYASNLIFSSGYIYAFKEPIVMKALAVSLGVPENAIILEDKATNTYKNVKFTKDILEKKGWSKALLVSSPYNMRRVSLVALKIAPKIKFVYSPIPQSRFYAHGIIGPHGEKLWKKISLDQIKGIIHEYLGIIYYWLKGYI